MTLDIDVSDRVTMLFETNRVRQHPIGFESYRDAIVAVMERLTQEDRETAVICGRWNTLDFREIAQCYATMSGTDRRGPDRSA